MAFCPEDLTRPTVAINAIRHIARTLALGNLTTEELAALYRVDRRTIESYARREDVQEEIKRIRACKQVEFLQNVDAMNRLVSKSLKNLETLTEDEKVSPRDKIKIAEMVFDREPAGTFAKQKKLTKGESRPASSSILDRMKQQAAIDANFQIVEESNDADSSPNPPGTNGPSGMHSGRRVQSPKLVLPPSNPHAESEELEPGGEPFSMEDSESDWFGMDPLPDGDWAESDGEPGTDAEGEGD